MSALFCRTLPTLVVAALGLVACGKGNGKSRRKSTEAPVVVVSQPQLPDAGGSSTSDEAEPNDGDDVATLLAVGGTVRAKIDPDGDVDHFRIDIDKPGALAVTVSGVDGLDLVLDIEDGSGSVIAKSDRGAVRTKEGVPNLGVTPGRYTAVVRAAPKKKPKPVKKGRRGAATPEPEPPKGPAPVYEITAQLAPFPAGKDNTEREPDDDRGTANDILPSDTASGYLGWTGDADVWKLSTEALSARNALEIDVSAVEGVALELELQDALGQSLGVRRGARGEPLTVHNVVPATAPGAPPFVYVVVRGDRSNPETPYQLKLAPSAVLQPDTEAEPDDSPDHPYLIAEDRTVVHALFETGDVDCFAAAPSKQARGIEFTIDAPSGLDLIAELFVDGKAMTKAERPAKGGPQHVGAQLAPNAKAVACVRAAGSAAVKAGAAYDVKVQESGATGDNAP